jgi:hypothetical protein
MRATSQGIRAQISDLNCITWQDMRVGGRIVISQLLETIDTCDMAVFDLTYLNENVLFEAGYAAAPAVNRSG